MKLKTPVRKDEPFYDAQNNETYYDIVDVDGDHVTGSVEDSHADQIVRAVNSHAALMEAAKPFAKQFYADQSTTTSTHRERLRAALALVEPKP